MLTLLIGRAGLVALVRRASVTILIVLVEAVVRRNLLGPGLMPLVGAIGAVWLGWIWGWLGGAVLAGASIPAYLWLSGLMGGPGGGAPPGAVAAFFFLGGAAGWFRQQIERLERDAQARRRAELELTTFYEGVPIGLFTLDREGRVVRANPAFSEMVGRPVEALPGMSFAELRADQGSLDGPDREPEGDAVVICVRRPDGEIRYGRFHWRTRGGLVSGSVRDVTELISSREKAAEAEEMFRTVFELAPIGMILTDRYACMFKVNNAFAEMLGYRPHEVVGRTWLEFTHPDDLEDNLERFREQVERAGPPYQVEKRYLRKDGSQVWASVRCHPVRTIDGTFRFQITQVVDITERKAHLEALARLVEEKDQFIASVSHELRTPLTVVLGLAEEMRSGLEGFAAEELTELVELIASQSREVAFLVEDLLVAARAEVGTVTIFPKPIDLRREVEQVIQSLDLDDVSVYDATSAPVLADPLRVRQIVRNLLSNALRHGGGDIKVEIESHGDTVEVCVSDGGPGIPVELRERIFQPYESAGGPTGNVGSVGLGLTVSRKLARLMGGDLVYRPGEPGSRFVLLLPAADDGGACSR